VATVKALDAQSLYRHCDLSLLPFQTTAEVAATTEIVGQSRASDAIRFGIDIQQPGYNLFVLGEPGTGRHSLVSKVLEAKSKEGEVPGDCCYITNFAEGNRPRLLRVPPGRGARLKRDMEQFVSELPKAIDSAFDSDEYRARIESLQSGSKEKEEGALGELGSDAAAHGIAFLRTPHGFAFAPLKGDEAMSPDEFEKLPESERDRFSRLMEGYGERIKQLMLQLPRWRRELQAQIKQASRETLELAVGHLIEERKEQYRDLAEVLGFLDAVLEDVVEIGEQLREQLKATTDLTTMLAGGIHALARYQVNLLVGNGGTHGAPIVHEDNPTYANLLGRMDSIAQMGTLMTNFTLIKPGALHRANGGYLVLDALKVLTQSYAWEGLKRALRTRQVRIEPLGQILGLLNTMTLEPEPMPLSVKVVLVGERRLYYLLKAVDPEFEELFSVAADFEDDLLRDADGTSLYAHFIATLAVGSGLRALDRAAVARMVEHGARLAGSADRLTVSRRLIVQVLQEADHVAATAGRDTVAREDVVAALAAQVRRVDRVRDRLHDEILRGNRFIAVTGDHIGQINGLAVLQLDDFTFAHPVRISATVRIGDGDVIDIERETELGGAIHSKGVMILAAFLSARFSREIPLSFSASLVFEQSYGPVEGDSASLAELCALMSDLARLPIKQSLAVTGSINQFGLVQPIGSVNEKIEGFFDICRARGLTGDQGVVIPAANVKDLMLRDDVVSECAQGKFHIFAVDHVDQAIELLTGVPAGEPDAKGRVPEGSVIYRVAAQLVEMSVVRQTILMPSAKRRVAKKRKKAAHKRK